MIRWLTIAANFFTKLIRQRDLIFNFAARDLRSRYVGSAMGFFWAIVHPLALLVTYSLVFSGILNIRLDKYPQINDNFAIFLFCGLLPFLYFQDTLLRGCESVVQQSNLLRKTAFPSEILPLTIVLSNLVTHLVGLAILVGFLLYFGTLGWALLLLPLVLLLTALFCLGLGWIAAALQVFLRDTLQLLSVGLTFWFWLTPIFYRLEDVPGWLRTWLGANPMRFVIEAYRSILLENRMPPGDHLLLLAVWTAVAFLLGGFIFRNTKRDFVDVL
ncbi:MAG TPA: ABC transporter permease [Acidobacteriota bacterium]|nr:ABC transporter permease [Acidobacteriota bacterium]